MGGFLFAPASFALSGWLRIRRGASRSQPTPPTCRLKTTPALPRCCATKLQSDDPIHGIAARRQHQDRRRHVGADPATYLEAIYIRQHHIEHDGVACFARVPAQAGTAAVGMRHEKFRAAEYAAMRAWPSIKQLQR